MGRVGSSCRVYLPPHTDREIFFKSYFYLLFVCYVWRSSLWRFRLRFSHRLPLHINHRKQCMRHFLKTLLRFKRKHLRSGCIRAVFFSCHLLLLTYAAYLWNVDRALHFRSHYLFLNLVPTTSSLEIITGVKPLSYFYSMLPHRRSYKGWPIINSKSVHPKCVCVRSPGKTYPKCF